jgi:hypothetical protein
LTSVGGISYTWGDRGNLIYDGVYTLVYTYNAQGLRVAQSVAGEVLTFTWDLASPLA